MERLADKISFRCKNGVPVDNPDAAHPALSNVDTGNKEIWPLEKTEDRGQSWQIVGYFSRNQFGKFDPLPEFLDDDNPRIRELVNKHLGDIFG